MAPAVYRARRRDARRARAAPGEQSSSLGELAGLARPRLRGSGVEEFYAALPDDVVCSASVVGAARLRRARRPESALRPVEQLEAALDKRPCAKDKPIWITETGVGGRDAAASADRRPRDAARDCRALDAALRRWDVDPRVDAAFQYTFREDPAFPVGLADAGLTPYLAGLRRVARVGGDRAPGAPAPTSRRLRGRRRLGRLSRRYTGAAPGRCTGVLSSECQRIRQACVRYGRHGSASAVSSAGVGQRVEAVGALDRAPDPEVADGEHVGPVELEHQEHVRASTRRCP